MDIQALKLAFTYHLLQQIADADADVHASERDHLARTFSPELMESCGFLADGQLTARYDEARDLALLELPDRLEEAEKDAVLEHLVDATAADGVLEPAEVDVLAAAARMLGVPDAQWARHVEAWIASGRLRRAE